MSVFFAIRDAIGSTKEGVFDFDAPATVENIRMSLNDPFAKKVNINILKSFNPKIFGALNASYGRFSITYSR